MRDCRDRSPLLLTTPVLGAIDLLFRAVALLTTAVDNSSGASQLRLLLIRLQIVLGTACLQ